MKHCDNFKIPSRAAAYNQRIEEEMACGARSTVTESPSFFVNMDGRNNGVQGGMPNGYSPGLEKRVLVDM